MCIRIVRICMASKCIVICNLFYNCINRSSVAKLYHCVCTAWGGTGMTQCIAIIFDFLAPDSTYSKDLRVLQGICLHYYVFHNFHSTVKSGACCMLCISIIARCPTSSFFFYNCCKIPGKFHSLLLILCGSFNVISKLYVQNHLSVFYADVYIHISTEWLGWKAP